ncbi:divergent PAP2 family protein [Candidatus Falkowbacteria bacterium]|nr:divergent PAP2 family protein [Candidatus Falkowbacteria bacterium]
MYQILLTPLVAAVIAQVSKFFIGANHLKIGVTNLVAYSGMPSGHSALMISLVTIIGLELGIQDPLFAVCVVLTILVLRDAVGLRRYLGQHGKVLNILVKDLKDDEVLDYKYPALLEKIGHTPAQVAVGSLIGFLVSLASYFIVS